jgi:hypothetical protein
MSSYVDNVRKNVVGLGQVQELGGQGPQVGSCFPLVKSYTNNRTAIRRGGRTGPGPGAGRTGATVQFLFLIG